MLRKLGLTMAVAGALALAFHGSAQASMWVATSITPNIPRAGDPVHLTVLKFYMTKNLCWDDPAASPIPNAIWYGDDVVPSNPALRIRATHPSASAIVVSLSQRTGDGAYWDGTIVFPSAGDWTLHVLQAPNYTESGDVAAIRCTGFQRTVSVVGSALPRAGHGGSVQARVGLGPNGAAKPAPLFLAAVMLASVAVGLGLVLLTRRVGR